MFMDEAAILQAAATLAAAKHTDAGAIARATGDSSRKDPVDRLLIVLASMAKKGLIAPEHAEFEPL